MLHQHSPQPVPRDFKVPWSGWTSRTMPLLSPRVPLTVSRQQVTLDSRESAPLSRATFRRHGSIFTCFSVCQVAEYFIDLSITNLGHSVVPTHCHHWITIKYQKLNNLKLIYSLTFIISKGVKCKLMKISVKTPSMRAARLFSVANLEKTVRFVAAFLD